MSRASRADLLRCLREAPDANRETLARLFGFGYLPEPRRKSNDISIGPARGETVTDLPAHALLKTLRPPQYWCVRQCNPEEESPKPLEEQVVALGSVVELADNDSAQLLLMPFDPLWTPGQWQNTWDRLLPVERQGREIDTGLVVKSVACGAPLQSLPKKAHKHWNTHTVLLLERSAALRPLWEDMEQARRSLLALLGSERLDCFVLDAGPLAAWRRFGGGKGDGEVEIGDEVNVIAIGAFGGLHDGRISDLWTGLFRRLHKRVHSLALLPVCPLRNTRVLASHSIPLDGHESRQADLLLNLLSQVWHPELSPDAHHHNPNVSMHSQPN
ncbi:MAG: hypothetical protein ABW148_17775 [Sedimenticola sp.]